MSTPKSITIRGGSDPRQYVIADAVTGEPINYIRRVEIIIDPNRDTQAILYLDFVDCELRDIPAELAPEQQAQEERIAQAVIEALTHKQDRYANALERTNAREIERIMTEAIEQRLPAILDRVLSRNTRVES